MPEPEDTRSSSRTSLRQMTAFETALIAGGFILFLVLLYEMEDFLSPPLLAAAGVVLLWPLRQHQTVRALLLSGALLIGLWFLDKLSGILIPFVVVYLLAYLFNPMVGALEERFKVPRWASSTLVTVLILGVIALILLLLVPSIVSELKVLASRLLNALGEFQTWLSSTDFLDSLERTNLIDRNEILGQLSAFIQEQASRLTSSLPNAAQNLIQSIGSIFSILMLIGVVPVLLFYTLKDYPHINRRLIELFPTFGGQRDYLVQASGIVGNYLRGQLTISAIAAFNVSVLLLLLDVPFALLLGLLAGLLNMIPNLGAIITNVIGVLVALIFGDPWFVDVIKVLAVLMGQSLLEQSILTPNILSHHVGLHPVLILLSLFVFGYFLGIFGLLIAVPTTALIMTFYQAYRDGKAMDLSDRERPPSRGLFHLPWRSKTSKNDVSDGAEETKTASSSEVAPP